jgi:hypothetical protein
MEKMIKFRDINKTWKMIDRKEFHRLVKKWAAIRKAERLAKAVEEEEVD